MYTASDEIRKKMGCAKIMRSAESHVEFSLTLLSIFVIYVTTYNTNKIHGIKNYKANKNKKIFFCKI